MSAVQTFTVTSDRLVGHERGSRLQADELGANVASLVAAGHLVPDEVPPETATPKATSAIPKKEQ